MTSIMAHNNQKDLAEDLGNMLDSGDTADVLLVCGDTKFPCHRSLLAARSSVFKTMFYGKGNFKERKTGQVVIEEFKPEEVKQFLKFIYVGECNFSEVDPWQILAMADKYDVQGLKKTCGLVLKESLSKNNCLEYVDKACLFKINDLISACVDLARKNPKLISDADWTGLAGKYPEIAVELFKKLCAKDNSPLDGYASPSYSCYSPNRIWD